MKEIVAFFTCPMINLPAQSHLFENKIHNIQTILSKIQNFILKPGAEFSFWKLVGRPDEPNGFREAATFIHHKVSSAVGGGVCQLSGLLYNLALLLGCKILERHPHSIDAYGEQRYVPLGRDATVAYPSKDLCFKNPHEFPLCLKLEVDRKQLQGWFLAERELGFSVEIMVSPPEVTPSPLQWVETDSLKESSEVIEQGFDGKKVSVWRIFHLSNGVIQKEHLSDDVYRVTSTVMGMGRRKLVGLAANPEQ